MTSKYTGREDDLGRIISDLARRLGRLETIGPSQGGLYGAVTDADHTTPPVDVTSGSFVTTYWLFPNPRMIGVEVYLRVVTGVATTMEVELLETDTATVISPVATVLASTTGYLGLRGRAVGSSIGGSVEIRARRASGAGSARLGLLRVQGGDYKAEQF